MELASAIFYVQGGIATRSWHQRNGHDPIEFPDLDGIRSISDLTLQPGRRTDVILSKKTLIPVRDAMPQLWVADVNYENLNFKMTFNTQFSILGRAIMQIDVILGSTERVLGLNSNITLLRHATIQPVGELILRPLEDLETWNYNRGWRAYVPVLIKVANPVIIINVNVSTKADIPPAFDDVFINITGVVQVMNSFLKYLGYAGEEETSSEDWELL